MAAPVSTVSYPVDLTKLHLNPPRKILSICGGGVRGIIPAYILQDIEKRTSLAAHEIFDLFAGTSTGTLVIAPLIFKNAQGTVESASQVVELFQKDAKDVFYERWGAYLTLQEFGNEPKYSQQKLESVINQFCGSNVTFKEGLKDICFTSLDACTLKPFLFLRREALTNSFLGNLKMMDVLCSTTAAPTYFSARKVDLGTRKVALIDGGLVSNDPSEFAYKEAQQIFNCGNNIITCTLGTGDIQYNTNADDNLNWGPLKWGENANIINTLLAGAAQGHHLLAQYNYTKSLDNLYAQPTISVDEENLDNASQINLDKLLDNAKEWITTNEDKLRDFCKSLEIGIKP